MIELCQQAGLPEPEFEQREGSFVVTIWRDWLTDEVLAQFKLNERQLLAIRQTQATGQINNEQYRSLTGTTDRTALRDLKKLTELGILRRVGETGQSAYYVMAKTKPA